MKNGKKISALIMILFSVDVAPKGFWDFLTRSKPVSTEGAQKPDENFPEKLGIHLEAHSDKQVKHTIPTSFQKLPSIADPLTEFGEQGDVTINEIFDSTTESNQLTPEEKKALLKLNKQRSFFSFFKKKLPSGEKGFTQQQQFSEDQNTFIKIVIKKLLIDPKYKITATDLRIFKKDTLTKEDLELVERTVNTVKDYVADVQEYYKITLKEKREYHQRQDMADPGYETIYLEGQYKKDLNEKIESLSKKLGYKYTAIFHKVLNIVNEEVAAYRELDQINAELNRELPLKASPEVIIVDRRLSRNPKAGKVVNIKIDDLKKQTEKDPSKEQELTALVDKHNALLEKARAQEQEIRNLWLQL